MNKCIICYDKIDIKNQIIFDNCHHGIYVHYSCIEKWNNTCPICRAPIYKPKINYLISIIYNIINYLINKIINQNNHNIDIITFIISTR